MNNILSGFTDEAGLDLETQIRATRELGWRNIEMRNDRVPGFPAGNLHDIPDEAFALLAGRLGEAGLHVHCFGSAIANGGKSIGKPFDACFAEAKRAAARAPRLGSRFVRVMSYPVLPGEDQQEKERFRRLREIVRIMSDAGVTVVHENCSNFGGMSWRHSLVLLENVPGLKLVFDTGNPCFDTDYSRPAPHSRQSSWEFYEHVRDFVVHLHVKDGRIEPDGRHVHTWPGEGRGDVRRILADLRARGYAGAISIEPHIGIAPEFASAPTEAEGCYRSYIEYGRRLERLLAELETSP